MISAQSMHPGRLPCTQCCVSSGLTQMKHRVSPSACCNTWSLLPAAARAALSVAPPPPLNDLVQQKQHPPPGLRDQFHCACISDDHYSDRLKHHSVVHHHPPSHRHRDVGSWHERLVKPNPYCRDVLQCQMTECVWTQKTFPVQHSLHCAAWLCVFGTVATRSCVTVVLNTGCCTHLQHPPPC